MHIFYLKKNGEVCLEKPQTEVCILFVICLKEIMFDNIKKRQSTEFELYRFMFYWKRKT